MFSPGGWLFSSGYGSVEVPPHLDKPEGHLAQGCKALPWKELFLSMVMCLPPPKPCMGWQLLSPDKTKPSPGILSGSLGRGLCRCPAGVCSVQSLITPGLPEVGAWRSILSSFLGQGSQLLGVQILNPSWSEVNSECWACGGGLGVGLERMCTQASGRAALGLL